MGGAKAKRAQIGLENWSLNSENRTDAAKRFAEHHLLRSPGGGALGERDLAA